MSSSVTGIKLWPCADVVTNSLDVVRLSEPVHTQQSATSASHYGGEYDGYLHLLEHATVRVVSTTLKVHHRVKL
jgi:hypothetical protein